MLFLSIIIPIYNVEPYIGRCIESILSQITESVDSVEVIMVNDGTQDGSMDIVKLQISGSPFVTVINQENKGLSCARNAGLDLAKGKYVWFVDSDDWLLPEAVSRVIDVVRRCDGVDMIATRLLHHDEATGRESAENFPSMSARTGREYMFAGNLKGASQRYILRRQFLLDNNLRFLPGVYHEDGDFGIRMTYLAQSCYVLPDPVYVYRLRKTGSIMSSRKQKMNTDLVAIYQGLVKFADLHVSREDYWPFRAQAITCLWDTILFSRQQIFTPEFKEFYAKFSRYIHQETGFLLRHSRELTITQLRAAVHFYLFPLAWTKGKRLLRMGLEWFKCR
ncbi:glycosyltransferase [Paraprevotella clara]|uniref:glycosyltransferase n=1 Tax=Paraprevotella clara TaxID=454154 RepID=UPI002674AA0A|nr:glycosyltransferase [Paraprevotella clara]